MTKQYLMPASRITTGSAVPTSAGTAGDLYVRNTDPFPSGYIRIGTAAELVAFAARVNAGEPALNACLTADIDMTGVTYTSPTGTAGEPYSGTFNGYGHVISNLSISSAHNKGVFGYTEGATITGIGCEGFSITCGGAYRIGTLIGNAGSGTSVANCYARNCTTSGSSKIGGLIGGTTDVSIENCYTYNCTVSATSKTAPAGGIVGYMTGSISNCATYGGTKGDTVYGYTDSTPTVTNCYSSSSTGVTQAVFQTQGFWDGAGVSGTTYLSWDFADTWGWNTADSLPQLESTDAETMLYAYNGSSWVLLGSS